METVDTAFGFVVDDHGPDKQAAGGALAFAARLVEAPIDEAAHAARCPSCRLLGGGLACVGIIPAPLSEAVEHWLVERLPPKLESVGGFLLQKAIGDFGYDGERAREFRRAGRLAAAQPAVRHYGSMFRRFTVSSEHILEELLCAGDISPAHALAILIHLGAILVDGSVPAALDEGEKLGALIEQPQERRSRTALELTAPGSPDPSLAGVKALIAALHAGFVLDADVLILDSAAS